MQVQPLSPLQVERLIGLLRAFGLAAGLLLVALSDFPEPALLVTAWVTLSVLSMASVAIWFWGQRSAWAKTGLVHAGFALDVLLIVGYAVSFAHIRPSVSWAVVFTVLADATIRYGFRGAVLGYVLGGAVLVVQALVHEEVTGVRTTALGYAFVLSTLFGVAGVLALFSHLLGHRAAEQREQALALADAIERQDRVIATSSHAFRPPLTIILGAAQMARHKRDRLSAQELDTLLDDIEAQGQEVQRLVDGLVSGGGDRPGGMTIRPRTGDLAETVRRAVEAASRHRVNHDLVLEVRPLVCALDHERLHQVVRNLVENAYKHTGESGRVTVSSRRLGVSVEVRVRDTGPGMSALEQERAFEPFRRRQGQRSESNGLGLYLVRQIITSMGGTVELRSSSDGSDFAVRVPATDFGGDHDTGH
jgi:signal transduction histidine kinase